MASPELAVSVLEAFKEHDTEHTGLISREGLKSVLQALDKEHWTEAVVEELFVAAGGPEGDIPYEVFVSRVFADVAPGVDKAVPRSLAKQLARIRDKIDGLGGAGADAAKAMGAITARIEECSAVPGQGTKNRMANPSHIQEAFNCYDADGSGYLEIGELASLARELGLGMDRSEVHRTLESIDTAGDGRISFPEFKAFMNASGASGSISQSLRMRIYNRKFDKAAKALGKASRRNKQRPQKVEAGEDGEMVLTVGEPIDKATLWANAQVSFSFVEVGGDEAAVAAAAEAAEAAAAAAAVAEVAAFEAPVTEDRPGSADSMMSMRMRRPSATFHAMSPEAVERPASTHTYQLKLRLAPPCGLSAQAMQANTFLEELQAGPPPGWQTAEVKGLDGGDTVEVVLGMSLDAQCDLAKNLEEVLGVASSGDAKFNVDVGSALDLKALSKATAENPYDVASNARLGARARFHVGDESLLDTFAMLKVMSGWDCPDEDQPEEEWSDENRFMKHLLPALGRWLLKAQGTVQLDSLAPVLGALSECRGHGEKLHFAGEVDKIFPDLRKITVADIKQAFAYKACVGNSKLRGEWEEKKHESWPIILSLRAIMSVIGLARGATITATTPRGVATADIDLGGLSGLHAFVPSWQDVNGQRPYAAEACEWRNMRTDFW